MGDMDQKYRPQLESIRKAVPFDIGEVTVNEGGDDFLLLESSSGWMFRFPRNEISREALGREVAFLAGLKELSPLPVPDYQYVRQDFGAYPKIQGLPLNFELFQSLSTVAQDRIGRQLAAFLSALHTFPLNEAIELGIGTAWNGIHHEAGEYFLHHVAPLLSPSARKKSTNCMEAILAENFDGRVIHGDFYFPDHVFFDEEDARLGVIDFADVTIYDPAHDFQCVLEIGGEAFFELVAKHYSSQNDPHLLRRSQLRLAARPLFAAGNRFTRGNEEQQLARLARIEAKFG